MKIIDKIRQNQNNPEPFFSFEFFPPKTEAGVENLYLRMDRMTSAQPLFIDITWGAGGCTKDLTMAICEYTQTYFGVDTLMHLTCTNLTVEEIKKILKSAKDMGLKNILALRGDPPKGAISWEPTPGGCNNAIDLVKLIRSEHGNYFCIGVAGFPEGHPYSKDRKDQDLIYLKEKIDAGADFILTQFFYDPEVFIDFYQRCHAVGIQCPIIPGMMPIQSYTSFKKMTTFCRTKVPEHIWMSLAPMKDNDEEVKEFGVRLCTDLCRTLSERCNVKGYHFYTLNLEKSVMNVLTQLGVKESAASRRYIIVQIYNLFHSIKRVYYILFSTFLLILSALLTLTVLYMYMIFTELSLGADHERTSKACPRRSGPSTGPTAPSPTSSGPSPGTSSRMAAGGTTGLLR